MAHNLHRDDKGQACMMYVRDEPWHGLGTKLDSPPTSAEAIKAARLDWVVKKVPLCAIEGGRVAAVPNRFAVVPAHRWSTPGCPVFGVVGKDYTPLQNAEAFAFFDSIVGMKAAMYHTAGALGEGEKVWILAKLPGEIRVIGEDITDKYLLLANGHDGNTAVQMKFTPVRVVCQNTLCLALDRGGRPVSVHHGRDFWSRMENAKEALGLITRQYERLEVKFKAMVGVQLNQAQLDTYLNAVFPDPPGAAGDRFRSVVLGDRRQAAKLFEEGPGNTLAGVKGTLWAAFNGVTGYVDHSRGEYTPEKRLRSIWFGKGSQIKVRAFNVACVMAGAEGS